MPFKRTGLILLTLALLVVGVADRGVVAQEVNRARSNIITAFRVINGSLPEYGSIEWVSNFLNLGTVTNGGTARKVRITSSADGIVLSPTASDLYEFRTTGVTTWAGLTTAGRGLPVVVAKARTVAATNVGTASVATFTVGAADATFEVGCNVLVTTATAHSFSCDVTYTDEGNSARTFVLPMEQPSGGAFVTTGLITNVTGTGPYHSPMMVIRAKTATAITVRTSSGGTFTTVVYNIDGTIIQLT